MSVEIIWWYSLVMLQLLFVFQMRTNRLGQFFERHVFQCGKERLMTK